MAHVQLAGGVGQHGAHIELGLFLAVRAEGVFDGAVDVVLSPLFLDLRFDFLRIVGFAHGAPFVVVFEGKIRPTSIRPFAPCLRVRKVNNGALSVRIPEGHRRLRIVRVLGWLSGYNPPLAFFCLQMECRRCPRKGYARRIAILRFATRPYRCLMTF